MNPPPQQKFRMKERVHSLKNPELRKIRYNLRSLLYLWYRDVMENYRVESFEVRNDKALSYEQRWDKLKKLREQDEELQSALTAAPVSCGWCNNKKRDLVFEPSRQSYFCVTCYEKAHQLYPNEYP
jgi:hypothetical protein